jgi:hypothetical protein
MRNTNSEIEKHLVLELQRITVALQCLTEFYDAERLPLPSVFPELMVEGRTATPKLRQNRGHDESGFVPDRATDDS